MKAQEFSQALGGSKTNNGYLVRCPAHNDNNPSLSIQDSLDGKLLWKCFAGCSQESVGAALKLKGFLNAPLVSNPARDTAEVYQNYEGSDVLKVIRKDFNGTKKFTQWSLDNGAWVPKAPKGEIAPLFYHEWKDQEFIILVEGEKCARAVKDRKSVV